MISIVPASPAHVGTIANRMRAIDQLEAQVFGHTPKSALRSALRGATMAWVAKVGDRPEAMFGISPISTIEGIGSIWMLGTDEIGRHPRVMVEQSRPYIDLMQSAFPRLENRVHRDNAKAIRWLKAVDFTIEAECLMVAGEPFRAFHRGLN